MPKTVNLYKNNPNYPHALKEHLSDDAPQSIALLGNPDILNHQSVALFCSVKCPGTLILHTYDMVQILRETSMTVIGGFHSPMEYECLTILLRGKQPVIICPARGIEGMRIKAEFKKPLEDGRLLILSPFKENQRRPTIKTTQYRNLFTAALSSVIFVTYAEPSGKTEEFCRQILSWQKPLYTFDSDFNKNIIDMGARPVKPENVSEWGKFFGHSGI
ncbi:MAG: DNA-processing protein DprA [Deltaproteobacteria bacterium]|nr:DNA-processing protein DprA [Deltaproteobacteria bacterium]